MGHPTLEARNLPYIPLPLEYPVFRPAWHAWPDEERLLINYLTCDAALEALNPSAIVFDCFPHASFLKAATKQRRRLVLVLRAMKDMDGYLAKWADFVSGIELFIIAEEERSVRLPPELERRSVFAGQIVSPAFPKRQDERARRQDEVVITVTGGGGGSHNALPCYNFFLDALRGIARAGRIVECTLVAGPLFHDWSGLHLFDQLKVLPFAPDIAELYARSDLILCQAGYNTLAELQGYPCRVICQPIETAYDDQFARAMAAAKDNPNAKIYVGSDVAALASLIDRHLDEPVVTIQPRRSLGAEIAATAISSFVSDSRCPAHDGDIARHSTTDPLSREDGAGPNNLP